MKRRYWSAIGDHGALVWNERTDEPKLEPVSVKVGEWSYYIYDVGGEDIYGQLERPKRNVWIARTDDGFDDGETATFDRCWKAVDWLNEKLEAIAASERRITAPPPRREQEDE